MTPPESRRGFSFKLYISYRNRMTDNTGSFLFPELNRKFFLRIACLVLITVAVCRYVFIPLFIHGESMLPAYPARGFNFCVCPVFGKTDPERGDVVILQFEGRRRMLLKRVLAFEGETVEFRGGVCFVNGKPLDEPYVKLNSGWNIPSKTVRPGKIYVMGDNRGVPAENHMGGEIDKRRIAGRPLW